MVGVEEKTACSIDELLKCQEEINREIISNYHHYQIREGFKKYFQNPSVKDPLVAK